MFRTTRYLAREEAMGDIDSKVYNLAQAKPISAIELRFRAHTHTPAGTAQPLLQEITSLQVIDGSEVLCSGVAHNIQAMGYGLRLGMPAVINSENTTAEYAETTVIIPFGRYIGDPEYYLDTTQLSNPQLRFISNMAAGAGYYTSGTLTCTVIVHTLHEGFLPRKGTVTIKEIIAATVAAAAEVPIDLPSDRPWINLGIFSEDAAALALHPIPTIVNAKLSIDNDSVIVFDQRITDILQRNIRDLGPFSVVEEELADWAVKEGYGLTMENITLEAKYVTPYGGVFVDFRDEKYDTYFTPSPQNNIRLVATGGTTGGVARILLAQLLK